MFSYLLGYGVFTLCDRERGSFVLDYCGELLSAAEGDLKANRDYIYFFELNRQNYWYVVLINQIHLAGT